MASYSVCPFGTLTVKVSKVTKVALNKIRSLANQNKGEWVTVINQMRHRKDARETFEPKKIVLKSVANGFIVKQPVFDIRVEAQDFLDFLSKQLST